MRFRARLEPVPHGGHFVVVPPEVAEAAGLKYGARVRGTVNGAPYRSSLMKYSGVFHMGVHKATLAEALAKPGASVTVTIELDDEPLPTDKVPEDLERVLKNNKTAFQAWSVLRPSARREHVKNIMGAKKPETRARRVAKTVASLTARR